MIFAWTTVGENPKRRSNDFEVVQKRKQGWTTDNGDDREPERESVLVMDATKGVLNFGGEGPLCGKRTALREGRGFS